MTFVTSGAHSFNRSLSGLSSDLPSVLGTRLNQLHNTSSVDEIHFSGLINNKQKFRRKEAELIAAHLFEQGSVDRDFYKIYHNVFNTLEKAKTKVPGLKKIKQETPERFRVPKELTPEDVTNRLLSGESVPAKQKYAFGLLQADEKKGFKPSIDEPISQELLELLLPDSLNELPDDVRLELEMNDGRVPMAVKIRDTFETLDYLDNDLLPNYKLHAEVEMPDGTVKEYKEAMLWPFLKTVLMDETVPDKLKPVVEGLEALPFYEFECPNSPALEEYLAEQLKSHQGLEAKLAALELTKLQYAEQLPFTEVAISLALGVMIGASGELGVEHFLHGEGAKAFFARFAILFGVDLTDNILGESAAVANDLSAYGMHGMKALLTEEGKPFRNRALKAGFGGAVLGLAVNWAPALAMTTLLGEDISAMETALLTGAGAAGSTSTSMGIPINYRITYPQLFTQAHHLNQQGLLSVPEGIESIESPEDKEAALDDYYKDMAAEELMIRTGMWSSLLSFSLSPLAGLAFTLPLITQGAVSPEWAALTYMTTSAGCENLYRLAGVAAKMKYTMDKQTESIAADLFKQVRENKPMDEDVLIKKMKGRLGVPSNVLGKMADSVAKLSSMRWYGSAPLEKVSTGRRFLEFIGAREHIPLSKNIVSYYDDDGSERKVVQSWTPPEESAKSSKPKGSRTAPIKNDIKARNRRTNDVLKKHGKEFGKPTRINKPQRR